jgi:hypothetical protein
VSKSQTILSSRPAVTAADSLADCQQLDRPLRATLPLVASCQVKQTEFHAFTHCAQFPARWGTSLTGVATGERRLCARTHEGTLQAVVPGRQASFDTKLNQLQLAYSVSASDSYFQFPAVVKDCKNLQAARALVIQNDIWPTLSFSQLWRGRA